MNIKIAAVITCFFYVLCLGGCETVSEEHQGAAVGAGVGAAVGAVAGSAMGDSTSSTVLGGLLGALVGGAIGHYYYDQKQDRDKTADQYNYDPDQGMVLRIESATASPLTIFPGDTVQLKMTYAVINPSPNQKTSIIEIREITHEGELVGSPEVRVDRYDGTYQSTVPITLPASAAKGTYKVRNIVRVGSVEDTLETRFTVK